MPVSVLSLPGFTEIPVNNHLPVYGANSLDSWVSLGKTNIKIDFQHLVYCTLHTFSLNILHTDLLIVSVFNYLWVHDVLNSFNYIHVLLSVLALMDLCMWVLISLQKCCDQYWNRTTLHRNMKLRKWIGLLSKVIC